MRILRNILLGALVVLGVYLIGRAIAEPFVIDLGDRSTYRHDWGGPNLIGVMAVHMVPGLVSLAGLTWWVSRLRHRGGRGGSTTPSSTRERARRAP